MDPGDQWSTNAKTITDSALSNSVALESSSSTPKELDTQASSSKQPLSTGSHPGSAGNPSPLHLLSTDDVPPQSPQPAPDHPPPSSPQPAPDNSHPPPSKPGPSTGPHQPTDGHSLPSTPGLPPDFELPPWVEDFLGTPSPPSTGSHQLTDDHFPLRIPEVPPGLEDFLGMSPSNSGPSTWPHQLTEDVNSPPSTPDLPPVSPSNSGPSTTWPHQLTEDVHPPPSTPDLPPGFEGFLGKFMKGKFKRRISGYGPWNVVQKRAARSSGKRRFVC